MKINRLNNDQLHFLNEDQVVVKCGWAPGTETAHFGVGDSLGRNGYAAFCYGEDQGDILKGLQSFFTYQRTSPETGSHWYVKRYPKGEGYAVRGNSRDHTMIALFALKELAPEVFAEYRKDLAKRPCIDHGYGVDRKMLLKAYDSVGWSWAYSFVYVFKAILRRLGMSTGRLLTLRHLRSHSSLKSFLANRPVPKSKWAKFVSKKQLIYPTYALLYDAVIRHGMKSKAAMKFTLILDRVLGFADKGNLVLKALYGKKITHRAMNKHEYCSQNRWSCRLDFTNDRDLKIVEKDVEGNVYHALLTTIFKNQIKHGKWNPFGKN